MGWRVIGLIILILLVFQSHSRQSQWWSEFPLPFLGNSMANFYRLVGIVIHETNSYLVYLSRKLFLTLVIPLIRVIVTFLCEYFIITLPRNYSRREHEAINLITKYFKFPAFCRTEGNRSVEIPLKQGKGIWAFHNSNSQINTAIRARYEGSISVFYRTRGLFLSSCIMVYRRCYTRIKKRKNDEIFHMSKQL